MISMLSTKKLESKQRSLFVDAGFNLVEYDAIAIEYLDFATPNNIENTIFTSQNGVQSILNSEFRIQNCFCVGQKTAALLEGNGLNVVKMARNSAELGDFIVKNHQNESFHYFCGAQRKSELPNTLKALNIEFLEVKTYKTNLKPRKFDQKWNGILFFSPSGVESYFKLNSSLGGSPERCSSRTSVGLETIPQQVRCDQPLVFCIGETTADAARNHSKNIVIANETSVESVIEKAVEILNK
ncbi:uroporphyrinogen-III synthase [Patiriisocius sp. Uisw_017]|jgi:uroporphyrinogen-III synthase|uniref:uroporphyrinogen-III synthase n=1 Tax=Patiriisocius sp. Uisw_017 TaxID=3230968 RepID=UPI0039E89EE4